MKRQAGVLCPVFCAPANQGIGDFGAKTEKLIDVIADAGYRIWQILPLQITGNTHSPYQTLSSYAGDPIYINIDRLCEMGLLTQSSIINCNKFKNTIDYNQVRSFKEVYFKRAFRSFKNNFNLFKDEYRTFEEDAYWLKNWALFALFRELHNQNPWTKWDAEYRDWFYDPSGVDLTDQQDALEYIKFLQFLFYKQWDHIIKYAHAKGLKVMGDVPFYVDLDSADIWADRPDFMVDDKGNPKYVAGCPPDYFSENGQLWGMPTYNFDRMKTNAYRFWVQRMTWMNRCFDMIRIDHFRAFDTYWKIPADSLTAVKGKWIHSPGEEILQHIVDANPDMELVAEDLGSDLGENVYDLEKRFGIPGMDVLNFKLEAKQLRKPIKEDVVLYTGTHDNSTLNEEYATFTNNHRISLRRFFKKRGFSYRRFNEMVCHFALASNAKLVMLPIWDICGYKKEARINTPGTVSDANWTWKLKDFKVFPKYVQATKKWLEQTDRL